MYIPSDVSQVFRHGATLFKNGHTIPFTNSMKYHIRKPSQVSPEIPSGWSKTYRSKVMLLNGLTKTKLYSNVLAKHDADKKEHLSKLLRFWCNNNDKEITAFGGSWNAKLDGANPEEGQTMINTAIRMVKAQIGLDLSYCKTWYKMLEIHYHRVNDKKSTEEHVEKTVIYIPSVWDLQPSQEDWDILKQKVFKSPEIARPLSPNSEAVVDIVCEGMTDKGLETEFSMDLQDDMDFEVVDSEVVEEEDVVVTPTKTVDVVTSEADIKTMKVTELRNRLELRGLSTKGLKIQLIARLQKSIKDEEDGPSSSDVKANSVAPTADAENSPDNWRLHPEIMGRINKLMARLGITDKDIVELPELASIVLNPAKGIEVTDFSLSSLLDYNRSDKKERVFEVSLFAEIFAEMLQRHFAILLLKAFIEAEGEEEQEKKADTKRQRKDTDGSETASHKESEEKKETPSSTENERYVHRPDLLMSFLYFDRYRAGYLIEDDILHLVHSIGLNISRSQIKAMIDKVTQGKSKLMYRALCEKRSTGGVNTVQQDTVNLREIEEVMLLGSEHSNIVEVDVVDALETEKGNRDSFMTEQDSDVVIINGSYVPKTELPGILSKALKKVAGLESVMRDLERDNDKLEKRIEESKNAKNNYDDLEQEVGVRKKELEILSTEKIRSELSARKFKLALEMTKTSLNGVISQINSCVEDTDKKSDEK